MVLSFLLFFFSFIYMYSVYDVNIK